MFKTLISLYLLLPCLSNERVGGSIFWLINKAKKFSSVIEQL